MASEPRSPTVFIVDDDPDLRNTVAMFLQSVGIPSEQFPSPREFLEAYDPQRSGCLLLDVQMPGMDGLELQKHLAERRVQIPIIILTGHGDVPTAVSAIKRGALDFIEKPFRQQVLLDCVKRAFEVDAQRRQREKEREVVMSRMAQLTPREREVLERMVNGETAEQSAARLGLSVKTIYMHRNNVMEKLQASTVADLVRTALLASS